jgi:tetratricopeptide (TPR) repeat protein
VFELHSGRRIAWVTALAVAVAGTGCTSSGRTVVQLVDGRLEETPYVSPGAYEHYLAGQIALLSGKAERAIVEFETALAFDPGSPYLHVRIAEVWGQRGQTREALDHLRQALRLSPAFPDALLLRARLRARDRQPAQAEADLRLCVARNPTFGACYLVHAELLEQAERPREAQRLLLAMAARVRGAAEAHARIAVLCLRQLDYSCAAQHLTAVLRERSDLDTLLRLAHVRRSLGDLAAAVALLREAFDRSGGNLSVAAGLLELLEQRGDARGVDDLISVLEGSVEDSPEQVAELAGVFLDAGRAPAALALCDSQLKAGAAAPALHALRAEALARSGRAKEAKEILRRQLQTSHGAQAAQRLARLLAREGAHAEASTVLREAITRHGQSESLVLALSASLHAEGKIEPSLAVIRHALDAHPDRRGLLFGLGAALERAGRWREAIAAMRRILARHPKDAPAHNFVGYTQVERGEDLRAAERSIREALYHQPGEGYIIDSLGWLNYKQGHLAEARRLLEIAVRLSPKEPEVMGHLADVLAGLHDVTGATALLRRAVAVCEDRMLAARLKQRLAELEKGRVGSR